MRDSWKRPLGDEKFMGTKGTFLMQAEVKNWLRERGVTRARVNGLVLQPSAKKWFLTGYLSGDRRQEIISSNDPVRYGNFVLSIQQLTEDGIPGSVAECGVWQGHLSRFLREELPGRRLFLFDTFEGFDQRDAESLGDFRFRDTSEDAVLSRIGDTANVVVRKGYFPETSVGLEDERFAFVVIDFDKYEATKSALEFFYPRVNRGGFILVHDFSNPESNWACSRALNEFLADKPEFSVLLPDAWGTALFRKV